jgi:hypothetical protein
MGKSALVESAEERLTQTRGDICKSRGKHMQDADRGDRFKTFTDSVRIIGNLGELLATLQADVLAIEGLPVDGNGNAEAIVNVENSASLHMVRIPPSVLLLSKSGEVARAILALKTEFIEILKHAEVLEERCKPQRPAEPVAPRGELDLELLERMTRAMQEEINAAPRQPHASNTPDRNGRLTPRLRPRVAQPRLHTVTSVAESSPDARRSSPQTNP